MFTLAFCPEVDEATQERSRQAGRPVPTDEILAHIAPIAFRHINFQGIYRFPLERYLDRLLPSALPPQIAVGAK